MAFNLTKKGVSGNMIVIMQNNKCHKSSWLSCLE